MRNSWSSTKPGRKHHPPVSPGRPRSVWPHRLAVLTAGATLLLIFVGGLVTNTGSALAVPDWPTTFGYNMFLYPWSKMVGGVLYEHSHRLIGSVVGMLTVACALGLWLTEPRKSVRLLGVVAVVLVIVQGILGGLRVVLLEHGLAIIHGCVAQAFLALMVSLATFTSSWWTTAASAPPVRDPYLRKLGLLVSPLVYLQIVFGALVTHTGRRVDAHVFFAAVVTVCVGLVARRILAEHADQRAVRAPASGASALGAPVLALLGLLAFQLVLGFLAYLCRFTVLGAALPPALSLLLPTTHRLVGALMLASAVVLTLRILRLHAGAAAPLSDATQRRHSVPLRQNEVSA